MDFEIFDEDGVRIIKVYNATQENIDSLNDNLGGLGAVGEEYAQWLAIGEGNEEELMTAMTNYAGEIAGILGRGVIWNEGRLIWYIEGFDDLPIVWITLHSSYGDCYWAEARLAQSAEKPSPWDWNKSNGSASAEQTQLAYNAVNRNGLITDFSHEVWNDMVSKVVEILTYISSSWTEIDDTGNTYLPYERTMMSVNDTTLTADRFNSLRFNIGSRQSTGINPVATGDTVCGWYFTQLTDVINNWINSI